MRVKITRVTARPHTRLQARGLHSGQERADWQPLVGRRLLDGQGRQVRRGRTRCWPDRYGRHHRRARGGAISDARDRAESIGRALAEILTCGLWVLGIHIGLVPLRVVLKGGGAFTRSGADGYAILRLYVCWRVPVGSTQIRIPDAYAIPQTLAPETETSPDHRTRQTAPLLCGRFLCTSMQGPSQIYTIYVQPPLRFAFFCVVMRASPQYALSSHQGATRTLLAPFRVAPAEVREPPRDPRIRTTVL